MKDDYKKPNIERLITTIRGNIADRVPIYEILVEARNVKAILGKDMGTTMSASRGATADPFYTPPMDPKYFAEICNNIGMDAMTIESLWTPLKYKDEKGDLKLVNNQYINDMETLENIIEPNWEMDFKPRRDVIREYVKVARENNLGVVWCYGAIFQCCYFFLCEFNQFLLKTMQDKAFVKRIFDICVKYYMKMTEIAIEEGVDVIFLADDIAYKVGPFISNESLTELWLPHMQKMVKQGRDAGLPIMFHSCGNVEPAMDDLIMKMDLDVLNPIEPYSMDIYDIKKRYGDRIGLSGNIDIAGPLAFGKPDAVREEVREHMEKLKPGGRYILSTNHSVMDDLPPENFRAMIDAGLEFGAYS
jgi:uroporphyrinogen decarboxylase